MPLPVGFSTRSQSWRPQPDWWSRCFLGSCGGADPQRGSLAAPLTLQQFRKLQKT